jgi:hypothetical protein
MDEVEAAVFERAWESRRHFAGLPHAVVRRHDTAAGMRNPGKRHCGGHATHRL